MCTTLLRYDLNHLQRKLMEFQYLLLTLNSKIDLHSGISCGNTSQVFGRKYEMLSKPLHIFLFLSILRKGFLW